MKQGSPEWLELRKRYITSSDAAVICDKNPWKTRYKLWREKNDLEPMQEQNEAMKIGNEMEPIARDWFIRQTGIVVEPRVKIEGFFMSSLDGISAIHRCILEIKCGQKAASMAKEGIIPDYYKCQIQHQLLTTGFQDAFYLTYWNGAGTIMEVKRDEDFIGEYIPKAKEFYECLVNYRQPDLCDKDYEINDSEEWNYVAIQYTDACEKVKFFEQEKNKWKEELVKLSQGKNMRGSGVKLSKIHRKGSVQYAKIPQIQGIDVEPFRSSPVEYWTVYN